MREADRDVTKADKSRAVAAKCGLTGQRLLLQDLTAVVATCTI